MKTTEYQPACRTCKWPVRFTSGLKCLCWAAPGYKPNCTVDDGDSCCEWELKEILLAISNQKQSTEAAS